MKPEHTRILRRVGSILLAIGLVDIAAMIYVVANDQSYSSSFNIFAVIAGIFLLRGSLRAAIFIRWFAVFMFAGLLAFFLGWLLTQPFGLLLTQLRLFPISTLTAFTFGALGLGLLGWIAWELGREPVKNAIDQAGKKQRSMRVPAVLGVGVTVLLFVMLNIFIGGESAERAKSMAEQQVGPGYRLHVTSLSHFTSATGTSVSGTVIAWNKHDIRTVPVQWNEE